MTTALRIAEVAARAGVTTATVRYYERIGVLPPPVRADNGYRTYDDRTVERLAFVARAKQLGCTLDEIADLTTAWDGGECGPVQDRLRGLVAEKIEVAQRETAELVTLTAELQRAAAALELHRPSGSCDARCGCISDPDTSPAAIEVAVPLVTKSTGDEATPIACTLPAEEMTDRIADWQRVLDASTGIVRVPIDEGVRLEFTTGTDVAGLARLATAEQECCRFFAFAITIDGRGLALEITAPPDAVDVVHAVFGAPS